MANSNSNWIRRFRRFMMYREEQVVAHGIKFSSGRVVIEWFGENSSVVVWDSIDEAVAIHGHDGNTKFVFIDDPPGMILYDKVIELVSA